MDQNKRYRSFAATVTVAFRTRDWRALHIESVIDVARVLYRDEYAIIRRKMTDRLQRLRLPSLRTIIAQGVAEGLQAGGYAN